MTKRRCNNVADVQTTLYQRQSKSRVFNGKWSNKNFCKYQIIFFQGKYKTIKAWYAKIVEIEPLFPKSINFMSIKKGIIVMWEERDLSDYSRGKEFPV